MEEIATQAAKGFDSYPLLGIFALVTLGLVAGLLYWFRRIIREDRSDYVAVMEEHRDHIRQICVEHNTALREMGTACHTSQAELTKRFESVTERNTLALDRNTEMMGRCFAALERSQPRLPTAERQV